MTRFAFLAATAAVCFHSSPACAQAGEPGAATLFGARESVSQMDISPDGTKVAYLTPGPGPATALYIADLSGGDPRLVVQSTGKPEGLRWCNFVTNDRLICNIRGLLDQTGLLVQFSRLITLDTDGKNVQQLGQKSSFYDSRIRQFDGDILDWLPGEDGAVLMARDYVPEAGRIGSHISRTAEGLGVDRIDVRTLKVKPVEAANPTADFYISDGQGVVRFKGNTPNRGSTGQLADRTDYAYRRAGSKSWEHFSSVDGDGNGMMPLEVDAATDSAYALQKLNGRYALYRVKLDGSMATELVYANDKVDVDDVVRIGRGARIIGVTFAEEATRTIYFDDEYGKLAKALGKAIPNLPLIDFVSSSNDNRKLLIHASSDVHPGSYYIYDKVSRSLNEILLARPELEGVKLASVKPITYPSGDGTAIPGYLTLPPGKESAKGLPAIVLPHGGPSARDEWGFDWLAQFLAHEGYAVLQPNYRGSAGFGDDWLRDNGFRSWRTSVGDVTAAGKWLVAQGIADPERMAIVGWSYGGYAALQSGVTEPDLFKAIVAIAPVTDFALLKEDAKGFTNASNVAESVGSGPEMIAGSPARNAGKIKAPVIMFHGNMDANVSIGQSRKMDDQLRDLGKKSQLVTYDGLEHSLVDSGVRADMLSKIAAFLATSLK